MSIPFSKRAAASVLKPWATEVFRMVTGSNQALSIKIFLVVVVTPLSIPPYTPAIHIGFSALHIIRSPADNFLSFSSSVVKTVPSFSFFTTILLPVILPASKACKGCPVSCNIKFVISTILLMGFKPMAINFCCSHLGLSATVMPLMLTPAYRLHAVVSSIITSMSLPDTPGLKLFL